MRRKKETEHQLCDSFLYSLPHCVVKRLFFGDPIRFVKLASEEWELGFADFIWKQALPFAAQARDWARRRDQFRCHPVMVSGLTAVLLVFPPPVERAQCHMALAVLARGKRMGRGRPGHGRYFTLERGRSKRHTVLCEWTTDGCHVNYLERPAVREDAFIQTVAEHHL